MKTNYFPLALISLAGCTMDSAPAQPGTSPTAANSSVTPVAVDSSPEKTVREYLNWYLANQDKLPQNFVAAFSNQNTTDYYKVDFRVTENWLAAVHKSGLLSDSYLQHWRRYFKQYADTLRLSQQNDGPARGFEYDFLMLSQEPDTRATELQGGTFTTRLLNPTHATVAALGPQHEGWREGMNFTLSKSATGKWLIDTMNVPDNLIQ